MRADKSVERSVDSLQRIYAAVVALSIGQAIQLTFLDRTTGVFSLSSDIVQYLPLFLAFAVTVVPFFHGMNRHLDKCYIEDHSHKTQGVLLFDFIVFFIEASLLFTIASTVKSGLIGFILIGLLLFVDTVWATLTNWIHYNALPVGTKPWALINAVTIAVLLMVYFLNIFEAAGKAWIMLVICTARTTLDYKFSWDFYFPTSKLVDVIMPANESVDS